MKIENHKAKMMKTIFLRVSITLFSISIFQPLFGARLTVVNGTGSGHYSAGTNLMLVADLRTDKAFDKWVDELGNVLADRSPMMASFVMPSKDTTITAVYKDTGYQLKINNGYRSGKYGAADTAVIYPNPATAGMVFDKWVGGSFVMPELTIQSFQMPASNTEITATYKVGTSYLLTANNASGGGYYAAGNGVVISAAPAPVGQEFDQWTGPDVGLLFGFNFSPTAIISMPDRNVSLTATYRNPPVVLTPPSITTHPQNQTVPVGSVASFNVVATGNPTPTYQWRKNGTNIAGATGASYTTPVTILADNGAKFTCVVSNSQGSVTSNEATLSVSATLSAPTITAQPTNQSVTVGQTATFNITATGYPTPLYQWRKNGTNIAGATGASYTTPVTTLADNGAKFTCVVSNSQGSVTSVEATLSVSATLSAPTITAQPTNQSVTVGQTATFNITATGYPTPLYQWRKNGTNIAGATGASYTTPVTILADNGAKFTCVVSNSQGSVTSVEATLSVLATLSAPTITAQPTNQSVTVGQTATFNITATGNPTPTFQWRKNGTNIPGATGASYTTPATTLADNGAKFTCVVSNSQGSVTSNEATLTVYSTVDTTPPSAPSSLRTNSITQTEINLVWNASTDNVGVVKYKVYRNNAFLKETTGLTAIDSGLTPNTLYSYKVTALDAVGNESAASNVLEVRTQAIDKSYLKFRDSAIRVTEGNRRITIPVLIEGPNPYAVVSFTATTLEGTAKSNMDFNSFNYTDYLLSGVMTGNLYVELRDDSVIEPEESFVVEMSNPTNVVMGSPSRITITIEDNDFDTSAPSAPSSLRTNSITQTEINLVWNASTDNVGVVKYKVYRNNAFLKETTGLTAIDSGLLPNTSYSYKVTAVDAAGNESAESNMVTVTTLLPDTLAPRAPGNLRANIVGQYFVDIGWNAATDNVGVVKYKVYRDYNFVRETVNLYAIDSELKPNTRYLYRVTAVDGAGNESDLSNEISVRTLQIPDTTPPTAPTNLRTSSVQSNQVVLVWNQSFDGESSYVRYQIFRDDRLIGTDAITTFTDGNVVPNFYYRYKVRVVNDVGLSADSEEIGVFTPGVGSGVEFEDDNSGSGEFKPFVAVVNPNVGPMTIDYDSLPGQSVEVKIYDRSGRLVRELGDINSYTEWDGRNSDGDMVASDTYLVYLKVDGKVSKRTVAIVK